jgi:hypothetical protein
MISGCDSQHKDEKIHRNHESVFSNKGRFEWLGTRVAHSHTRVRVSSTTLLRYREVVELRVVPTAASRSEGWRVLAHDVRSPRRARADETCRCVFRSISASIIGEAYNLFPGFQLVKFQEGDRGDQREHSSKRHEEDCRIGGRQCQLSARIDIFGLVHPHGLESLTFPFAAPPKPLAGANLWCSIVDGKAQTEEAKEVARGGRNRLRRCLTRPLHDSLRHPGATPFASFPNPPPPPHISPSISPSPVLFLFAIDPSLNLSSPTSFSLMDNRIGTSWPRRGNAFPMPTLPEAPS